MENSIMFFLLWLLTGAEIGIISNRYWDKRELSAYRDKDAVLLAFSCFLWPIVLLFMLEPVFKFLIKDIKL